MGTLNPFRINTRRDMLIFRNAKGLSHWLENQSEKGYRLGFVPTMGALHPGHISLLNTSISENKITVTSIFVNPTQFNDPKDFEKYPVTIENDTKLLESAGCDVLFLPDVGEIYPGGMVPRMKYDLGFLEKRLEGEFRPGHYQGVCMVVHRLLDIVNPEKLYLGQKDYQQCMVIRKLLELTGKTKKTSIRICPTFRETDGLAMSSRNMRLNYEERDKAVTIFKALSLIKDNIAEGDVSGILVSAREMLQNAGFRTDYLEITDATNLSPVHIWDGRQKIAVLVAAYLNEVRLIDNMILN